MTEQEIEDLIQIAYIDGYNHCSQTQPFRDLLHTIFFLTIGYLIGSW